MPPEVQGTIYGNIKFTKKTTLAKLQKQNADPITIWKFNQIDTNKDGKLDKNELNAYNKSLETKKTILMNKQEAIKGYEEECKILESKIDEIARKSQELEKETNYFQKLLEFEKEKRIEYFGVKENEEIPENGIPEDVEWRCMGIEDENKEYFTDNIYKKGYIKFPDDISEEDKKKYLELLKSAKLQNKKAQEVYIELEEVLEEYQKYKAVKDLVENNIISPVNAEPDVDQAYELYKKITDVSNPFYKLYKEAEEKYYSLAKKIKLTTEDKYKLAQYYSEMMQYKEVSDNWSVANIKNVECENPNNYINIAGERVTFTKSDDNTSVSAVTGFTAGMKYGDFTGNTGVKITNTAILSPEFKIQYSLDTNGSIIYDNQNGYSGGLYLTYLKDPNMSQLEAEIKGNIKNVNINLRHSITKLNPETTENTEEISTDDITEREENQEEPLNDTVETTDINVSYPILNNILANGSIHKGQEGTFYGFGLNAEKLNILKSGEYKLNVSPSFGYNFNTDTLMNNINAGVNTELSYGAQEISEEQEEENNNRLSWKVNGGYSLSSIMKHGIAPIQTKTLAIGAEIKKGFTAFALNAVNTVNDSMNSWVLGGSISTGKPDKNGKLSIEGNYTVSNQRCFEEGVQPECTKEFKITMGYVITVDALARKLGFKK